MYQMKLTLDHRKCLMLKKNYFKTPTELKRKLNCLVSVGKILEYILVKKDFFLHESTIFYINPLNIRVILLDSEKLLKCVATAEEKRS